MLPCQMPKELAIAEAASQFTICCLLYGDYPKLAERLLSSLWRPAWVNTFELRVGLNNVSDATRAVVDRYHEIIVVEGEAPYYKYPTMRKLFYGRHLTYHI